MDVAATEFCENGLYKFEGKELTSDQMISYYSDLEAAYPLVSIEDPLDEDDWVARGCSPEFHAQMPY